MPLSTEVFVMSIFIFGLPFFYAILCNSGMPGRKSFMTAYILLTLSNIFTVIEEFWLNAFFNLCEHCFITLGSLAMLIAIINLTTGADRRQPPVPHDGRGM